MRGGSVIAVTTVLAAVAAGCDSSSESTDGQGTSPASTSTAAEDPSMRGAPEAGTCRNVPPKGFALDYWFDDSPVVLRTAHHGDGFDSLVGGADRQECQGAGFRCWNEARQYVGVDLDHWVPWGAFLYLPSKEQVAAGARWLRCDVGHFSDWDNRPYPRLSPRTFSARDAATEHADILLPCLGREPHIVTQPVVSCSLPHMYEATGQLAWLESLDHYPRRPLSGNVGRPSNAATACPPNNRRPRSG